MKAYDGMKAKAVTVTILDPAGNAYPMKWLIVEVLGEDGTTLDGNKKLAADEEITVIVRSNNPSIINIGENGLEKTVKVGKNFGKAKIDAKKLSITYTGEPIELTAEDMENVSVTYGKKAEAVKLTYGEDYEIVGYRDNIKKGTMTVYLQGIGSYSGTKALKVKISPQNIQ